MKLGVIAALRTELEPTLRTLPSPPSSLSSKNTFYRPPFTFLVGGVGAERAAGAALCLLKADRPDALVSVGFCGALSDSLAIGDLLLGGTTRYEASAELLEIATSAATNAKSGRIATVTRVLNDAAEKRAIAEKTGALAVEMEADAVGRAAKEGGVGFLCVKVVIDTPAEPLASTYAGFWSVAKDLLLHPGTIMQMAYDAKRVKLASERLRDFFVALKEKLPVS